MFGYLKFRIARKFHIRWSKYWFHNNLLFI
jgi:hypothetical protein